MPASNSQTFSLFFSTLGTGSDDTIQQVPIIGTTPGAPSTDFQGTPYPDIQAFALDPLNGYYFLSVYEGSNNGTLSSSIYEERFGQAVTFTTPLLTDASGSGYNIVSFGVDAPDETLFYNDGAAVYRLGYGANSTSQIQVATLPLPAGPMAYDQQDHAGYFAANTGSVSYGTTAGGNLGTIGNFTGNYIYKVTGLTSHANGVSTHVSTLNLGGANGELPIGDGIVQSLSFDSANDTLYFLTFSAGSAAGDNFGLYSYNPNTNSPGTFTTIWQLPENSTSYLQNTLDFTVDPLTGDYFISTEHGGIFEGSINSNSVPTASISTHNIGDGQASPIALAIDDGATLSSVTVAAIDGNTAQTTGQIQPGDTLTIDVTFNEPVNVQAGTTLNLNNGGTATYVSGSGTGTLVFSYQPSSSQSVASLAVTSLNGTVTDLAGTAFNGASVSATFNGVSVDGTPPALGVNYTPAEAVQGGSPLTVLTANPTITDPHGDGILTSAKVVLTNDQAGDDLGFYGSTSGSLDGGAIDYSFANGTLSFTGDATLSQYEAALAGVTYQDTGTDTSTSGHPVRTVDMSVTEGSLTSTLVEFQLTIDRPPVIAASGYAAEVVENQQISGGAGAAFAGDSDPDGDALTVTQVTSSQGIATAGNQLEGSYGALTLNADGSYSYVANNSFAIGGAPGGPLTDQFVFTLSDGNGGSATETLTVAVDRPPELSGSGTVTYYQALAPVTIDPNVSLSDPDGDLITGASVAIGSGFLSGDQLDFSNQNGITGFYDQTDGLLTLTGDASATDYQALLQSLQFSSTAADPTAGGTDTTRIIDITLNEQSASGASIASNNFTTQIDVAAPGVVCYAAGTRILTPNGEVPVESLKIGDCVVTATGEHRPIQWLGHRTLRLENHPKPLESRPVRIAAHAIAEAEPHTDLLVSPWHAICVNGVLVPARYLLNDATITQVEMASITYWHIELETHDIILANGLPAESYLERGNRKFFVESAQVALSAVPDGPQSDADFCRPIIRKGEALERIRRQLTDRAALLAQPGLSLRPLKASAS